MKVRFLFPEEVSVEGFSQLNLLAHAQLAERSLQSRCGGQSECGTCRIILLSGRLSPLRSQEKELLEKTGALKAEPCTRLACQSFPETEEVVLLVPQCRFPDARRGN